PSVVGQSVTFTATVSGVSACTNVARTGTVTFTIDGGAPTNVTVSGGQAILTSSTLSVGSHTISAAYSGDANYNASTSANLTQTVNKANTTATLTSSLNPSYFGDPVTFTATVNPVSPGAGTRTGTVQF